MTTLPTTTPIRLPRPAGATPLAIAAPVAAQPAGSFQMSGADVWRVIRANIWLILIAIVLSLGLGWGLNIYLMAKHSQFRATGLVQVNPPVSMGDVIAGRTGRGVGDVSMINLAQRTQGWLPKQESLFAQVLGDANADIRKTSWWASFGGDVVAAKEDLEDNFRA